MLLSVEEELCHLQTVFRVTISCWFLIEVQLDPTNVWGVRRNCLGGSRKTARVVGRVWVLPGSSHRRDHNTVNRHGPVESCVIIQSIDWRRFKLTSMYNPVDAIYFDIQKTPSRTTAVSRFLETSGRLDWSAKENLQNGVGEGFLRYYNNRWFFCCSEGKSTHDIDWYPSKLRIMWY